VEFVVNPYTMATVPDTPRLHWDRSSTSRVLFPPRAADKSFAPSLRIKLRERFNILKDVLVSEKFSI